MNTNAYLSILASALAATAIAGCDAGQDSDPYADQGAEPAEESSYAADDMRDTTEPDPMDRSVASDRPGATGMQTSPQDPAMTGDTATPMQGELAESEVVGQTVVSQSGEEIGTVVQIVDGEAGGRLAIVDVGEFLGIGEKPVAIDTRHLSLGADGQLRSDVTADTLRSMPEYDAEAAGEEIEEEDAE